MTTLARRNSSIHKVREYQLEKIQLEDEYEVLHVIQEGWRGRLLLVEHRRTRHEVVLKAMHRDSTSRLDFFREFHYNYYLSPHLNILNAYDVAFEAGEYYVFAQEYAPFGDLTTNLCDVGLGEINTKRIALQLASALDFMHSKDLVHRDMNMDNILIFKSDFSHVKLCDFGSTRKKGTLLKKRTVWLPYAPPEIVDAVQNEGFHADTSQDVWQLGILIYVLLTGQLPWQKADLTDPNYADYINWRKRRTLRTPKRFTNFTSRLLRLFKRLLEPKPEKRASVREVYKYMDDKWLLKLPRRDIGDVDGQSVCYSTFSAHSCPREKDRVLRTLKAHGIETTVDRIAKRQRIHEWLERSLSSRNLGEDEERAKDDPLQREYIGDQEPQARRSARPLQSSQEQNKRAEAMRKQYEELTAITIKLVQAKASKQVSDTIPNSTQDSRVRNGHLHHQPQQTTHAQDQTGFNGAKASPVLETSQHRGRDNSPCIVQRNSSRKTKGESGSPQLSRHAQSPVRTPTVIETPRSPHINRRFHKHMHSPNSSGRERRGERQWSSGATECGYQLQRSKTDSYFVTGSSRSPPSRQTSQESDSTDTSLNSLQPVVLL
ncbi:serine/threonine-protein kinase meng-po isoform X2 [Procambarus clarkii]|uniref:serine/threonine-protein kinase meng-po isoform X2 n=1 Tax=Procambarus clarkii TaxID=6728 RepID=UPI001E6749EF|nr:serine/threonine-protein kinase meng-po-like [Procambarus clarkii]